uniref:NDUEG2 n=2 Tax=Euglena gracilis TaxID=3039 RepID=UPI002FE4FADC
MVIGTFFKTGFEKGLPLHEQVVRHLLPLVPKARKGFWPYYFAVNERVVLPRRAGAALNSRLRIPGKNRRECLPTSASSPLELAQLRKATDKPVEDVKPQVFVSTSSPSDAVPLHNESVHSKWLEALDEVNKTASTFSDAFEIQNESLSKEIFHRLAVPASLKAGNIFAHDGAFGSNSADDIKFTAVTHDPTAALFLRHMVNPVPQVDPVDFPNLFSVFHIHDYEFTDPRIVEEFDGVKKEQLGITSPRFVLYDLAERNVYVSGSSQDLRDAIVCLGGLVAFHLYGSLTLACNSFIDKDGKLTLVFGSEANLNSPQLFGAHHSLWTPNGVSRAWNGVTVEGAKAQFASDLVEVTAKGPRLTAPLPLQLGGTARPRGANLLAGAAAGTPEPPLAVDPKLPWRPNVVSAAGAKFVFVGKEEAKLSVDDAAALFADSHAAYPLGFSTKKKLAAKFKELAATAPGASFVTTPNVSSL